MSAHTCPTCGPTSTEQHPRRKDVMRCANCKEWLTISAPEVSRGVAEAFVAGWFAHARNPKDAPLLVEDAWHAYRLIESADTAANATDRRAER